MKKIIFLTVFACLLTMLASCDPEPIPPGPSPVTYTISTVISGKGLVTPDKLSMINLGSNVTLKFTPETGYSLYSVRINGVMIEDIQPSSAEVFYTIHNINKNQNVEVVFVETDILIVSVKSTNEKPWWLTKIGVYKAEGDVFLRNINLTESEKTDRYYLIYPSMKTVVYQADGGVRNGKWDLKQRVFTLGGLAAHAVLELSSSKFVYKAPPIWSQADNFYIYVVYTQERK